MTLRFFAVLLASYLCLTPQMAHAASCCTSAAAFGIGRLLMHEKAATGFQVAFEQTLGSFDKNGEFDFADLRLKEQTLLTTPWAMVRLHESLSAFVQLPWKTRFLTEENQLAVGSGLANIVSGVRFQLVNIGEFKKIPGIALQTGLAIPTGRPAGRDRADIVSDGLYTFFATVNLEQAYLPWFVQLNTGIRASLPSESGKMKYWPGLLANTALVSGLELMENLVMSLGLGFSWQSEQIFDGKVDEGSKRFKTSVFVATSYRLHPQWTLQGSIQTNPWISGLGKHLPASLSTSVGIRYGIS